MKVNTLEGASILITGGTGSFGSTMARHALSRGVEELRIFSRDEAKQDNLRHQLSDKRVKFVLGDTRDFDSTKNAVRGVDFVFHAAALKQVPSAEFFPLQAVKTNIDGSANVLRASLEESVSSVVCLSTDKAVYPINAMGMSKALMEKTAQAFARESLNTNTRITVTRYGNVMHSRGSVIPLFISQIKAGGPITLTDPTMTRFLMSLAESVDLVDYAFRQGNSGDLLVRKAPAATVLQIAEVLMDIFSGGRKVEVKQIGFRHGEKLYESLLSTEERARAEDLGDYFRVPLDTRGLDYDAFFEIGQTRSESLAAYTSHNTQRLSNDELRERLVQLPQIKEQIH